jgi:dihydrofolate reductase
MRKVIVFTAVTLDGVMQAPARPDEDRRGGFPYGGWAAPYDGMTSREAAEGIPAFGGLLLGRRTYEDLYDYWPKQTNNPFTERLNSMQKYVVSTTLKEPLAWQNSTLIKGNLAEAVSALKAESGNDLMLMASSKLTQSLMKLNLIDRYVLMIHPLVLGTGQRLFDDIGQSTTLQLVSAKPTPKGVVVAIYQPVETITK